MSNEKSYNNNNRVRQGLFNRIRSYMDRNRIGELLVTKGRISESELEAALLAQRDLNMPLGEILVQQNLVSKFGLQRALFVQSSARITLAMFAVMLSLTTVGSSKARAGAKKPVENKERVYKASYSAQAGAYEPILSYPALFGSTEKSSTNITPFKKWNNVIRKFDASMKTQEAEQSRVVKNWMKAVKRLENLPLEEKIHRVNDMMNSVTYLTDKNNYGTSDYWATPAEFLSRGGDCEDFAIAKYASLKALGVPEARLRLAIVHDNVKNIPHAILIVYAEGKAFVLDNQMERVMTSQELSTRYKPLYTINRTAWWLHKKPTNTILASAQ